MIFPSFTLGKFEIHFLQVKILLLFENLKYLSLF